VLGRLSQLNTRTLHRPTAVLLAAFALVLTPTLAFGVEYAGPPEDYARYEGQTTCAQRPKPGTRELAGWINRRFGGGTAVASLRSCGGGASEHKDGRAIDWTMDATRPGHRAEVERFLARIFTTDRDGHADARARRMGVMYVIWNDEMYASYRNGFEPTPYLSSSCKRKRTCSPTLRHRDHVHISLSKAGGRAETSWYVARR
jgi:hypothetical protein